MRDGARVVELYVVRHAIAEPRSSDVDDAERALTAEGRARFERAVEGLRCLGVGLDAIVHSPWRRAVETATLLSPRLEPGVDAVIESEWLADDPGPELLRVLGRAGPRVAAVGHEPWMSELVAWLSVGDARYGASMPMKKGGVAWLRGDPRPGGMTLRGLWAPKHLRAIAR